MHYVGLPLHQWWAHNRRSPENSLPQTKIYGRCLEREAWRMAIRSSFTDHSQLLVNWNNSIIYTSLHFKPAAFWANMCWKIKIVRKVYDSSILVWECAASPLLPFDLLCEHLVPLTFIKWPLFPFLLHTHTQRRQLNSHTCNEHSISWLMYHSLWEYASIMIEGWSM